MGCGSKIAGTIRMNFLAKFVFGQNKEFVLGPNQKPEAVLCFRFLQDVFQNSPGISRCTRSLIVVNMTYKEAKFFICKFYNTKTLRIGKKKPVTGITVA